MELVNIISGPLFWVPFERNRRIAATAAIYLLLLTLQEVTK
jgi:hypothetical protein